MGRQAQTIAQKKWPIPATFYHEDGTYLSIGGMYKIRDRPNTAAFLQYLNGRYRSGKVTRVEFFTEDRKTKIGEYTIEGGFNFNI